MMRLKNLLSLRVFRSQRGQTTKRQSFRFCVENNVGNDDWEDVSTRPEVPSPTLTSTARPIYCDITWLPPTPTSAQDPCLPLPLKQGLLPILDGEAPASRKLPTAFSQASPWEDRRCQQPMVFLGLKEREVDVMSTRKNSWLSLWCRHAMRGN